MQAKQILNLVHRWTLTAILHFVSRHIKILNWNNILNYDTIWLSVCILPIPNRQPNSFMNLFFHFVSKWWSPKKLKLKLNSWLWCNFVEIRNVYRPSRNLNPVYWTTSSAIYFKTGDHFKISDWNKILQLHFG